MWIVQRAALWSEKERVWDVVFWCLACNIGSVWGGREQRKEVTKKEYEERHQKKKGVGVNKDDANVGDDQNDEGVMY